MKQIFTSLLFLFLLSPLIGQAPTTEKTSTRSTPWELGGSLSTASFAGDLVGPDASSIKATSFSLGAFGRLAIADQLSLRLSLKQGRLSADDKDYPGLEGRGYSFKKNFTELILGFEWEPLGNNRFQEDGSFKKGVSPYLFLGMGGVFGTPKVDYGSPAVENDPNVQQDLVNLKSSHFTIPFGLGAKAYLSPKWTLSAELGLRPVFNDYLDGVSYAGNPDANDWYGVFSVMLGHRLGLDKD